MIKIYRSSSFLNAINVLAILVMGALLLYGASWQIFRTRTDAARYQCYAEVFWKVWPALNELPKDQCIFMTQPGVSSNSNGTIVKSLRQIVLPEALNNLMKSQNMTDPFHALPHEYPSLTIIPFSLGLIAPQGWYQVFFAIWMALIAAGIYVLLVRFKSRWAAFAFAIYLVIGCWGTAAGRFDLVPSALTLIAVIFGIRKHWNWAFAFLALATLLKFYPLVLV